MKLGSISGASKDGQLVVVSRDLKRMTKVGHEFPSLQYALDHWERAKPCLEQLYERLNQGFGERVDFTTFCAPLPRAYEWVDGSAFINHVVLIRKARKAPIPETLRTDPLVYQGGSGILLGAHANISLANEEWGCDFESEVCVVLDDTIQGCKKHEAEKQIRLLMIANDVSLRNLIPNELAKGFGFFNSKPATAFAPVAVTPDEVSGAWKDGRLHLPLKTWLNGKLFGDPDAGSEMHFSFHDLIEHICKTRSFTAGTILGSGTVSNEDRKRGSSCLAEKRMIETIENGEPSTPFLRYGDQVDIEMYDAKGQSIFGRISQKVSPF